MDNVGKRSKPCGTLALMVFVSELEPSTTTEYADPPENLELSDWQVADGNHFHQVSLYPL